MFGNDKIIQIDNWYWTTEDLNGLDYLKHSHKSEFKHILKFLEGNEIVVQAGGHCGYVIRELLLHFKTIYTFEPDPTMFTCLCLNVPEENVYKFQACLGEDHKTTGMEINPICPTTGAKYVKGDGDIPVFKIDDLALKDCSLIMLDIEGNEYNAIIGATETIKKFHPLLCIERYWGPRTTNLPESVFDNLLIELGYKSVCRSGENKQDHIYQYEGNK